MIVIILAKHKPPGWGRLKKGRVWDRWIVVWAIQGWVPALGGGFGWDCRVSSSTTHLVDQLVGPHLDHHGAVITKPSH